MRKIKEETIHTLARIGRKYRLLRYPILAVLVIFVFIYNVLLYGFIHFKMRERLARGLAMAMTVVLVFTSVDLTVLAMSADPVQTENYEEEGEDNSDSVKAPEESANPETSAAPGESADPEESMSPETTAEPEATPAPGMTVSDGNAQVLSENVVILQQRINALPTVEEFIAMADGTYVEDSLWNEAQMKIYYEMQDIADIYDSLTPEQQAVVDEAGQKAVDYEREINRAGDEEIMNRWTTKNGVTITPYEDLDIDSFKNAVDGIDDWFISELKAQNYEDAEALVAAFRK